MNHASLSGELAHFFLSRLLLFFAFLLLFSLLIFVSSLLFIGFLCFFRLSLFLFFCIGFLVIHFSILGFCFPFWFYWSFFLVSLLIFVGLYFAQHKSTFFSTQSIFFIYIRNLFIYMSNICTHG